ncbi:glycosyltransferase family protein [Nitrosopumilus sp.]|nr:glycosyltransferase family protein [Nitrosopumilus sp.]
MIGCIIQARTNSKRLPKKILKILDDKKNVLEYVINQVKNSTKIDKIVIATTEKIDDDIIMNISKSNNCDYFRGSEKDVLDRYFNCAKKFNFDVIVRITSDCPLIDPEIIDKVLEKFLMEDYDYVTNTFPRTYPKGLDVEVFSYSILERMCKDAKLPSEREHVTQFILNHDEFRIGNVEYENDLSQLRWTLDQKEDLDFLLNVIKGIDSRPILMDNILKLLEKNPELKEINSGIDPDQGIKKSKEEDKIFLKGNNN